MKLPVIKGEKVILRPLSLRDAQRFCTWLADPDVTVFLQNHGNPPTLAEEREWIRKQQRSKDSVQFAIDDQVSGEHIGICSLLKITNLDKRAEFGIFIGNKRFWGQGYGTEATWLLCNFGFRKLKLHRIYLRYIAYNFRGEKAYARVGFKKEGILRQHYYRNGNYHDGIIMGLLKNELKNPISKKK